MSHPFADESPPPGPRSSNTPAVQWLIAISVAIYFLQLTVVGANDMIALLGFQARDLWARWWTAATYMFVHGGFWHVALNMYMLFLFGPRVEREWSAGEFTRYYLLCGLGGLLLHLVFFRDGAMLIGASAAVFGVALAYARRWPDDEIYLFAVIPLKVKWWIALLVLVDLVSGLSSERSGIAHFAHLGGFLTGYLYLRVIEALRSDGPRPRIKPVPDFGDEPPRAIPRGLPRQRERVDEVDDIVAKSKAVLAQRPNERPNVQTLPPPRQPATIESELDGVLDKISQHGIESLTEGERRLLEDASRKMRGE